MMSSASSRLWCASLWRAVLSRHEEPELQGRRATTHGQEHRRPDGTAAVAPGGTSPADPDHEDRSGLRPYPDSSLVLNRALPAPSRLALRARRCLRRPFLSPPTQCKSPYHCFFDQYQLASNFVESSCLHNNCSKFLQIFIILPKSYPAV